MYNKVGKAREGLVCGQLLVSRSRSLFLPLFLYADVISQRDSAFLLSDNVSIVEAGIAACQLHKTRQLPLDIKL